MDEHKKAIVGGIGGLATWLATSLADGGISTPELGGLLLAVLTGAGVYQATNTLEDDGGATWLHFLLGLALVLIILALVGVEVRVG